MSVSHRGIYDFLRDEYGLKESQISQVSGGVHCRLFFKYNGIERNLTLPWSPSDSDWEAIKRQDIRRTLGDPPPKPEKQRRTLDAMTADLKPLGPGPAPAFAPLTLHGSISLYRNRTLWFGVPKEMVHRFTGKDSVARASAEFDGSDGWTIRRSDNGPRVSASTGLSASAAAYFDVFDAPFSCRKATYMLSGPDTITVKLDPPKTVAPETEQSPPDQGRAIARYLEGMPPGAPDPEAAPPQPVPEPTPSPTSLKSPVSASEDEMRAVLQLAREIEARSPYRLRRIRRGDEEVLVWTAPTID